ncbi:MAG: M3 family oligoendopeptidase [Planctomycetota bacterium]|jgi:oligoendopeptidase F
MTQATQFDATRWDEIEPAGSDLLTRDVATRGELERWLVDRSEFDAVCSEARANLYITMTCHTDDAGASGAWTRYLEEVRASLEVMGARLDERQIELSDALGLDDARYTVMTRDTRVDVELFREANVPIKTELAKLDQRYDEICGAMAVEFRGTEHTIPQMGKYQEDTDRATRQEAWSAVQERRQRDVVTIDEIFDTMVGRRDELAHNAGFENYRDYAFRAKRRFDYRPADCEAYHNACARAVVPILRSLDGARGGALDVDALRPWDLSVDIHSREALRPFDGADELVDKTRSVFDRMGEGLGGMFDELTHGGCLDLESRKGKAPGGYQYMRDHSRMPFIFMNAAGLHSDVRTMLHEAGHAFHSQLCRDEPLLHYRHSPIEFAEVASMSMELLSMPYWDSFYADEGECNRARREQLEGIVGVLPWIATIDAFQHWIYTHPTHTREERTEHWVSLLERFGHDVSWEGLEAIRDTMWQRQGHLFGVPFYYIEYGIAQLGALQLWKISLERGLDEALSLYKRALSLGGSRPLPELFEAAGVRFDFSESTMGELMTLLDSELRGLPE